MGMTIHGWACLVTDFAIHHWTCLVADTQIRSSGVDTPPSTSLLSYLFTFPPSTYQIPLRMDPSTALVNPFPNNVRNAF